MIAQDHHILFFYLAVVIPPMDVERLKEMGKDQLIALLQGNTLTAGRSAAKIECKDEPPAAPAASQASVPPVPTQAVDFNGSLV